MPIVGRFSPSVEPLSLDEFLDITGTDALLGPPVDVTVDARDRRLVNARWTNQSFGEAGESAGLFA